MIQARNPKLKTLINKGKEKIITYYQTLNEESQERVNAGAKEPDTEWIIQSPTPIKRRIMKRVVYLLIVCLVPIAGLRPMENN